MIVTETDRLRIRQLTPDDAEFMLELFNDPSYIANISDRGVRTVEAARETIVAGPVASYEKNGFGLWLVELKETGEPMGISGLIKRDTLEDVDVGYAFLPRYWGRGYALESAAAALAYGRDALGLKRVIAITTDANAASIRVLERLGMSREGRCRLTPDGEELLLFAIET